ncbi:MAG: MFS transporter, partial [Lachnospiraceae bacterium]|nr:MFS transporter [Lachnospiraceae bacterium]
SSAITMFMGVLQILVEPLVLSFAAANTLRIAETVCACGLLASGLYLGVRGIKNHFVTVLGMALMLAGLFMTGFGLVENIYVICIFGFLFFMALPFANNCLDYLVRTNIADEVQGRAWGMIGFISQMGYVVAYAVSGVAADTLGSVTGAGVGRGSAYVIIIAGICLAITSVSILFTGSIRKLENVPGEEGI